MTTDGSGKVSFIWGDGEEHTFFLGLKELRDLEAKTGAGAFELFNRLTSGTFRVDDPRHVIRLGMIGGGKDAETVARMMKAYVFPARPLLESVGPSLAILSSALTGPPLGDDTKKAAAEPKGAELTSLN